MNFGSTNFKRDIPMYAGLYLQGRMNLYTPSRYRYLSRNPM